MLGANAFISRALMIVWLGINNDNSRHVDVVCCSWQREFADQSLADIDEQSLDAEVTLNEEQLQSPFMAGLKLRDT